jgi:hypothetical protein
MTAAAGHAVRVLDDEEDVEDADDTGRHLLLDHRHDLAGKPIARETDDVDVDRAECHVCPPWDSPRRYGVTMPRERAGKRAAARSPRSRDPSSALPGASCGFLAAEAACLLLSQDLGCIDIAGVIALANSIAAPTCAARSRE